jgi:threonine-phosphate decarboxylase
MIQGHGGNVRAMARQLGCRPDEIADMSSNINPLGMPPGLSAHLREHLDRVGVLPEADAVTAVQQISGLLDIDPDRVLAGSGTTQFIYTACLALNTRRALIVGPTYADYADACRMFNIDHVYFLTEATSRFDVNLDLLGRRLENIDTVFICNPNNPTGRLIPQDDLYRFCRARPGIRFIIDESYLPFAPASQSRSMIAGELENVSVLWSASKIFGIPGLRAGFLIADQEKVSLFRHYMQPWCLNSLAQAAIEYIGGNASAMIRFIELTRGHLEMERRRFQDVLAAHTALDIFPSVTSYFLIRLPEELNADEVCGKMIRQRILIRNCRNFYGLSDRFIRVALKDPEMNQLAADCLAGLTSSF